MRREDKGCSTAPSWENVIRQAWSNCLARLINNLKKRKNQQTTHFEEIQSTHFTLKQFQRWGEHRCICGFRHFIIPWSHRMVFFVLILVYFSLYDLVCFSFSFSLVCFFARSLNVFLFSITKGNISIVWDLKEMALSSFEWIRKNQRFIPLPQSCDFYFRRDVKVIYFRHKEKKKHLKILNGLFWDEKSLHCDL